MKEASGRASPEEGREGPRRERAVAMLRPEDRVWIPDDPDVWIVLTVRTLRGVKSVDVYREGDDSLSSLLEIRNVPAEAVKKQGCIRGGTLRDPCDGP